MTVKVYLKDGRTFDYKETALFDDAKHGWIVLSYGALKEKRKNLSGRLSRHYTYDESDHIAYPWGYIEKVEVLP